MNDPQNYRRRRPQRRRTHKKIFFILFFCILVLVNVDKIKNIYANSGFFAPQTDTPSIVKVTTENVEPETQPPDNMVQPFSISRDLTAANVCMINSNTNVQVFDKNSDEQIAPASTTKMLTALTVVDYCDLDDVMTAGSELDFVAPDASRAWLNAGDTLTVRQLLVAMLLPSGNDAAYTLAVNAGRKISGDDQLTASQSIERFVQAMNEKAADIGAVSSNFTTPDGYDAEGQYTTAYDLTQIAKASLANRDLAEIMGTFRISNTWLNGREVTYYNSNALLDPDSVYYDPDVIGLKTGHTGWAGACLVSAIELNGQTYICAVMGSTEEGRFQDSQVLYGALRDFQ